MRLARRAALLSRKILSPYRAEHAHRVASLLINPSQEELATAYLHDVLEDTDYKEELLRKRFGKEVASWVFALSHEPGVRDFSRLKDAAPEAKRVKLADRIDNIKKRVYEDRFPSIGYVVETEKLLEIIQDGDERLAALLRNLVEKLRQKCAKYQHDNDVLQVYRTEGTPTASRFGRRGWEPVNGE